MPKSYRIGVIGRTGRGNYGHGLGVIYNDFDHLTVVALADEDEQGRAAAARQCNAQRAYADYREMLEKEDLDIVSVAPRWLDCHRDMVLACARHGCHIFLEKPMCQTLDQADVMVTACERAHVKLAIAHQTRFSPRIDRVRELLADGTLGDIVEMRGRGKEDRRGGGEDLMVLGTHIMDLMRYLAGDAKWCYAQVLEKGQRISKDQVRDGNEGIGPLAGEHISAMYGFENDVTGYFETTRPQNPPDRFGLRVYTTKGILDLRTGGLPPTYFCPDPAWTPGKSKTDWVEISSKGMGQPEPLDDGGLHMGNHAIVLDLIEAIENDTQPRGNIYDGRAALEMILATYESHRLNAPVPLPLKNRKHPLTLL
jgi:predicted dehydrogenase